MKKFFAMLIIAMLALSAFAFAETTYTSDDISFTYDETVFEVTLEDRTDDETTVIINDIDEALGGVYVRFYLHDLEDDMGMPTLDDFADMPDTVVTQGEWNGYSDVFMYELHYDDGITQSFFIAPVTDAEDGEIEAQLTVEIGVHELEDEDAAMTRDDMISAVLDTLAVDD